MATKQRHQTWGPAPSPVEQLRTDLGLDAGRDRPGSAFRGRRRDDNADRLLDALTDRLDGRDSRPRHARWGDEPSRLPAVRSAGDLGVLPDAEITRRARISETRAGRLLPWQAGAATAIVGTVAWGLGELAGLAAGLGGHLLVSMLCGLVVLLGLAGWAWSRRALWAPAGPLAPWRSRARVTAAGATGWIVAWSATGPSWPLAAVGLVAAAAASASWLRVHEADMPPRDDVDDAEPEADVFAQRWAERVACQGGQVPGSWLDDGRDTDDGMLFTLQLPSGWTVTAVNNRLEAVASALGSDPRQLIVEHVAADGRGWVDASKARLQYLHRSPIIGTEAVEHGEPTGRDGRIGLGPYIDGSGEAEFVLADGESVWSGFICGATGAGKSELATRLVVGGRATLPIVTVYWDGKRGSSSPELAAAASVKALGPEEAEAFTTSVEALVRGLQQRAAATGEASFQWGPRRRIYWIVLDEADILFKLPGMPPRWEAIAKTLRSLGGGILALSQEGDLPVFGNSNLLRSSICRNVVMMRIPTGSSGHLVAPGLPSPASIPMGGGYAHLLAEGSRPAVLLRARRLRSVKACRRENLDPADTPNAAGELARFPDAEMCEVGRAAFRALLDPTAVPDQEPVDAGPSEAEKAAARAAWGQGPTADTAESAPDRPESAEQVPPRVEAPAPTIPEGLTSNQRAVLGALREIDTGAGPVPTAAVASSAELRVDSTGRALKALAAKGHIGDAGRAGWTAATASPTAS